MLALLTVDAAIPSAVRLPELARAAAESGPDPKTPLAGPYDGAHVVLLPAQPDRATRCAGSWPRPTTR